MKRILITALSLAILILPILSLYGCAQRIYADDLMKGYSPNVVYGKGTDDDFIDNQMRLSLELLKEISKENIGKNHMISPLSIQLALAMTANGAKGKTREELESFLGGEIDLDELNRYLYTYLASLPSDEKYEVTYANSIWFRDDKNLKVKNSFLQKNIDYYGAGAFKAPFDHTTVSDINKWVSDNTKGMIKKVIENITSDTMLYLINALTFEAEWESKYIDTDIRKHPFFAPSGEQNVDMMYSSERIYIENENAVGFIKNYSGQKYSFVALLPNVGMTPEELISSLDSASMLSLLKNKTHCTVNAAMPSFETDFDAELNDGLRALGVNNAFLPSADFSDMATHPNGLFIGNVIHKTYIKVDASGTKAGAVTVVEVVCGSVPSDVKNVILDRPFVYMIIDNATSLPLFIGVLNSVK